MIRASAVRDPTIDEASVMRFSSIGGSIENLDLCCQENLDQTCKEIPYHHVMELQDIIAKWIKDSRTGAGLTQPELAEAVGKTKA